MDLRYWQEYLATKTLPDFSEENKNIMMFLYFTGTFPQSTREMMTDDEERLNARLWWLAWHACPHWRRDLISTWWPPIYEDDLLPEFWQQWGTWGLDSAIQSCFLNKILRSVMLPLSLLEKCISTGTEISAYGLGFQASQSPEHGEWGVDFLRALVLHHELFACTTGYICGWRQSHYFARELANAAKQKLPQSQFEYLMSHLSYSL